MRHRSCRRMACTIVPVLSGFLLVLLAVWATLLFQRLTPLHTPIICETGSATVRTATSDSDIELVLSSKCENHNAYHVETTISKEGRVFMGKDFILVSSAIEIPRSMLPASGSGSVDLHIKLNVTVDTLGSLLGFVFAGKEVPIYIESRVDVVIDTNLLPFARSSSGLGGFKTMQAMHERCGFNLQMPSRIGPMSCAGSFDQLELQSVSAHAKKDSGLSFDRVTGSVIDEVTHTKDVALISAMSIGYGVGIVLVLLVICTGEVTMLKR
mmetsp:Transcript_71616/g.180851  ORF Transcript_71616/g.180851 Transcript_71616/m.180851 type:complete len:268 (+) Transcript_71616:137-940(+)